MCDESHGKEDNKEVYPHCGICEPAKLLQRSNLANEETRYSPEQAADSIAELKLYGLGQGFAIRDND